MIIQNFPWKTQPGSPPTVAHKFQKARVFLPSCGTQSVGAPGALTQSSTYGTINTHHTGIQYVNTTANSNTGFQAPSIGGTTSNAILIVVGKVSSAFSNLFFNAANDALLGVAGTVPILNGTGTTKCTGTIPIVPGSIIYAYWQSNNYILGHKTPTGKLEYITNNSGSSFGSAGPWDFCRYIDAGVSFLATFPDIPLVKEEILDLLENPYSLFEPQKLRLPVSISSGGAYTLTASSGSYTLSGQDATILKSKVLNADQGTYTLTGQSASLFRSKVINAAQGSYALTGQSSTILRSKVLTAGQGSYTLTGQNATITYTGSGVNYTITADVGNYTYTGQAATIKKSKVLNASTGTYNVAGQAATLAYSGSNIVTLKAGSWIRYRTI